MVDNARRDCRVRIMKSKLCVRYVKLFDQKYKNIYQSFPAALTCYPIKCVVMKTHFLVQGISSLNGENAHVSQLPNRVFMTVVDNLAYSGSIAKNPFNFRNFSASQVAIYLNGEMPAPSLNFASIKYSDGYRSLFATAGLIDIYDGLVLRG